MTGQSARPTFGPEQLLPRARAHHHGCVFDVDLGDRVGRVLVPEDVAVNLADHDAIARWVAEELRHLATVWSHGVVVGRLQWIDGLELGDHLSPAGSGGNDWLRPAELNSPVARKRRS